jgi:hypothetical protein
MSQVGIETQTRNANTFEKSEVRAQLRDKDHAVTCWQCGRQKATDIHHLDGNHQNDAPDNLAPWCKRCHNEYHDISDNLTDLGLAVAQFYAIQDQRIAMSNRVTAYHKLGYDLRHSEEILDGFKELEKRAGKLIAGMVARESIYQAFLRQVKGCGPLISGSLISMIGDPGRFNTISTLWAYAGLDVRNGKAPKRAKGEVANWNGELRTVLVGKLVPSFIKLKDKDCFGRELYDQYKRFYQERDSDTVSKLQIENRARRKVAKVFLSCLWVAWRRLKGLPVTEPYAFDKLGGHHQLITPDDWTRGNGETGWMEEMGLF